MGRASELRTEIKQRFLPFIIDKGFLLNKSSSPFFIELHKITPKAVYVCSIQWDKYGRPRFVINFGRCGPLGVICHGQHIPPENITESTATERGRLQPGHSRTTFSWFRQDKPFFKKLFSSSPTYPAVKIVDQLISLFAEIEVYWERGTIEKHISILPVNPKWIYDVKEN